MENKLISIRIDVQKLETNAASYWSGLRKKISSILFEAKAKTSSFCPTTTTKKLDHQTNNNNKWIEKEFIRIQIWLDNDYRRLNTIIIIFCSPPFLFCFYNTHKHTVDLSILYVVDLVFFSVITFDQWRKTFSFFFFNSLSPV